MAEDRAGSFVMDAQGNAVPNPDDEAMVERRNLKKNAAKRPAQAAKEEVKKDA